MDVTVKYHRESEGYWAESPEVEGLSVTGATLHEVRELVHEALSFFLEVDVETIDLRETFADAAPVVDLVVGATPGDAQSWLNVTASVGAKDVRFQPVYAGTRVAKLGTKSTQVLSV